MCSHLAISNQHSFLLLKGIGNNLATYSFSMTQNCLSVKFRISKILKKTRNSYFYVTPKNHRLMFDHENIKKHCHKKVIVCFYNLGEENF